MTEKSGCSQGKMCGGGIEKAGEGDKKRGVTVTRQSEETTDGYTVV